MSGNRVCHFKLVLLGDTAVGKSCLVVRFVRDEFFEFQEPTIGGEFLAKTFSVRFYCRIGSSQSGIVLPKLVFIASRRIGWGYGGLSTKAGLLVMSFPLAMVASM